MFQKNTTVLAYANAVWNIHGSLNLKKRRVGVVYAYISTTIFWTGRNTRSSFSSHWWDARHPARRRETIPSIPPFARWERPGAALQQPGFSPTASAPRPHANCVHMYYAY